MKASLKKKYAEEKFQQIGVSGFIFLRLFCVAILAPKRFGIVQQDPDAPTLRTLTLITKIMQHLANFSQFGAKERHMEYSNEWINSNTTDMKTFINDIAVSTLSFTQNYPLSRIYTTAISNSPNAASPICKSVLSIIDRLDSELEQVSRQLLVDNAVAQQKYEANLSRLRPPQANPIKRPSSAVEPTDKNFEELLLPVQRMSETSRSKTRSQPAISQTKTGSFASIKEPVPVFVSRPSIKLTTLRKGTTTSPQATRKAAGATASQSERPSEAHKQRISILGSNRMSMSAECLVDAKYEEAHPNGNPRVAVQSPLHISNKTSDFADVYESPASGTSHNSSNATPSPTSHGQHRTGSNGITSTSDQQRQGLSGFMNRFKTTESPIVVKTGSTKEVLPDASPTSATNQTTEEKQFTFMTLIGGGVAKKISGSAMSPRTGVNKKESDGPGARREVEDDNRKESNKLL
ncbi:UNVERIFIED_CONTAM: hypothetical protein HDU68_002291 [Siphonaria sp. JEL0065]|nr:hypothetical protein HDU68_002291 [Siphonaria sp. JEL0065]